MSIATLTGSCEDLVFSLKRAVLGPNKVRRTRLYCVGTGKSGTHSIARMFSRNVRSKHEPEAVMLIRQILDWRAGKVSDAEMAAWVRERDRRLALEVDSSTLNMDIIHFLVSEFPDAKFVLTIRDCYSWFNSQTNHRLKYEGKVDPIWYELGKLRGGGAPHTEFDAPLKELGLPSTDHIFNAWTRHNETVLNTVPADRLLVVRTHEINKRAEEIAKFAGLPPRVIRHEETHSFKNTEKQEVIQLLDPTFIEEKVAQYCRPLMTRFFPEIKSLKDARL